MYASNRVAALALFAPLCALSAFSQISVNSVDQDATALVSHEVEISVVPGSPSLPAITETVQLTAEQQAVDLQPWMVPERLEDDPGAGAKIQPSDTKRSQPADFNQEIYYRNKLEFSLNAGWLPINIPFPLDIFVGDAYNTYPLKYTLVPIFASLRWQIDSVGSPWILRGNWDMTFTGSVTAIPRGPESRYFIPYGNSA